MARPAGSSSCREGVTAGSLYRIAVRAGGTTLADQTPEPLPPELAPFVAHAQSHLEQATEGLDNDQTIAHLEAAMARAEVEASRLGFRFPPPEIQVEAAQLTDGVNPVVVIQRLAEGDPA
ncbi:MAG TPA: hypothetical protein VK306_07300 [Acidimicrobiales bacterium]|nr:hypothetical protein [Acidimicrobiales bacterium]